ncbi:MAG: B-box zinc finger protein [Pseudomonadota bacterium]|nr:B-box zinc finger protein [Pseudomonadota bacterium]
MNRFCKYHPGTEALWYCDHDGLTLCQACVDGQDDNLREARCLLCNRQLASSGQAQSGPLWGQLDHYFRYPLSPVLLPALLVWGLVAALVPPLPLMVLVALVGGLPAFGFAHAVMVLRSQPVRARKLKVPGWGGLADMAVWKAALMQVLPVVLVMGLAGAAMIMGSILLGVGVGVTGLLFVPAFWLAIQVRGAEPGSYATVLTYMFSAPRDYRVVALFASLSALLAVAVIAVAVDVVPLPLAQGVAGALAAWWWLALAALCGDVLARQGRLWGIDQGVRRVTAPLEVRRQQVQLCAGRFDKVLLATAKTLKTKKATVQDWHRYDQLLAISDREEERMRVAPAYLEALVAASAWPEALALLRRLREAMPGWLPAVPSLRLAMAKGVMEKEPKTAVTLLKDLHDRHPEFAGLGEAYLLLARILAEQFGLAGKAEQYLRFVESHCRDAKLRKQVADYRQTWG